MREDFQALAEPASSRTRAALDPVPLLNRLGPEFNEAARSRGLRQDFAPLTAEILEAVDNGDAAEVDRMLRARGPVDGRNDARETALMIAAEKGFTAVIRVLLTHHADTTLHDQRGRTAVMHAVHAGQVEALKALLEGGASANPATPHAHNPLQAVIMMGDAIPRGREIFDALITGGANAAAVASDKVTLVMAAAAKDDDYALTVLLEKGANPEGVENNGQSAIGIAAHNNSVKAAKILLKTGVDLAHVNDQGRTARQEAEHFGFTELAALIEKAEVQQVSRMMKDGLGKNTPAPRTAKFKKAGDTQAPK